MAHRVQVCACGAQRLGTFVTLVEVAAEYFFSCSLHLLTRSCGFLHLTACSSHGQAKRKAGVRGMCLARRFAGTLEGDAFYLRPRGMLVHTFRADDMMKICFGPAGTHVVVAIIGQFGGRAWRTVTRSLRERVRCQVLTRRQPDVSQCPSPSTKAFKAGCTGADVAGINTVLQRQRGCTAGRKQLHGRKRPGR